MINFLCALSFFCSTTSVPVPEIIQVPIQEVIEQPTPQQEIFLDQLSRCESSGSSTVQIIDSNNEFSTGCFQFQYATWKSQSEKYELGYIKEDIWDCKKQRRLAHLMLKDGGERNWFNCTNKIGDYPH